MKKTSPLLIIFISLVTLISFLINVPNSINIPFLSDKPVQLVNINTILKPLGLERNVDFRKGLDLEGGTSITLAAI